MFDLIIIGGGPTGINCAISAQKKGLDYLVIEKGMLVNSLFNFPSNMTFFSTSKLLEIGDIPFISHTDKPTRKEALEYYRRLVSSYDLNINFYERVEKMTKKEDHYSINTSKSTYMARSVIVATGFYDTYRKLNVPGEDLPKVKHYYDEAHHYINQKVLVIGAANSACDVALETWQKGAEVTMAVRKGSLYDRVKYWILPNIQNRIKEGSITAYFKTEVVAIREKEVDLRKEGKVFTIPNDWVLAMTGYLPDYELMARLGIDINDDEYATPVFDPETLESNLPNVYLAGVLNSGKKTSTLFIENTRHHGDLIIDRIKEMTK